MLQTGEYYASAKLSHAVSVRIRLFFDDTSTTEFYTLSLHDALPICHRVDLDGDHVRDEPVGVRRVDAVVVGRRDRKSTRLNSSHVERSYAVLCLKKKSTMYRRRHSSLPTVVFPCIKGNLSTCPNHSA